MTVLNFPASPSVNDTYTENNVTYTWNGSYWDANNTGSLDNLYVEVAGDSMTGNLILPGGGGNAAALQKQEIEDLPISTFDNDSGYITSSDIPPGTVSYWNKDGSDLKPVSDTDNVNIGDGKVTLNATDGSGKFASNVTIDGNVLVDDNGKRRAAINGSTGAASFAITDSGDAYITLGADGSGVFKEDIQSTSQNGGQLAGFRNQLINGSMLIDQRGNNLSNPAEFCPDRWFNAGTSILGLNRLVTAGFKGAGIQPVSGTGIVRQAIELPKATNFGGNVVEPYSPFKANSVWTLSLYADSVSPGLSNDWLQYAEDAVGTDPENAATGAGWVSLGDGRWSNTYTFNGSSPADNHNCLLVQLQWTDGRIGGVQLEPGPVATPFEHRPIQTELALCQRYYYKDNSNRMFHRAALTGPNSEDVWTHVKFPVSMRAAPTTTSTNTDNITPSYVNSIDGSRLVCELINPAEKTSLVAFTADAEF